MTAPAPTRRDRRPHVTANSRSTPTHSATGRYGRHAHRHHAADGDYGQDGKAVRPPRHGYHFVDWSDGVTDRRRTDTDVTADLT